MTVQLSITLISNVVLVHSARRTTGGLPAKQCSGRLRF
jgi:hypothetical protein